MVARKCVRLQVYFSSFFLFPSLLHFCFLLREYSWCCALTCVFASCLRGFSSLLPLRRRSVIDILNKEQCRGSLLTVFLRRALSRRVWRRRQGRNKGALKLILEMTAADTARVVRRQRQRYSVFSRAADSARDSCLPYNIFVPPLPLLSALFPITAFHATSTAHQHTHPCICIHCCSCAAELQSHQRSKEKLFLFFFRFYRPPALSLSLNCLPLRCLHSHAAELRDQKRQKARSRRRIKTCQAQRTDSAKKRRRSVRQRLTATE